MKAKCCIYKNAVGIRALVSIYTLFVLGVHTPSANAQDVTTPALLLKLQKPVHLDVKSITLEQIAARLSQETGLTIEAAPYLRQHQITVQCDGATAQSLLETFAELNDWQWQERSGKIVIERRLVRKPRSIAEIPATVQSALAKDVRRYLRDGAENTVVRDDGNRELPDANTILGRQVRADLQEKAVSKFCQGYSVQGIGYAIARMTETLRADYPDSRRLPWKKMTDWQQRLLVAQEVLSILIGMDSAEGYQILHGRIQPYYVTMQGMQIEMPANGTIQFGLNAIDGKGITGIGFGQGIDPKWLPIDLEQH